MRFPFFCLTGAEEKTLFGKSILIYKMGAYHSHFSYALQCGSYIMQMSMKMCSGETSPNDARNLHLLDKDTTKIIYFIDLEKAIVRNVNLLVLI